MLKLTSISDSEALGVGSEAPVADRVLCGRGEQSVAGLDLGVGDGAVGLDGDEKHDFAADVHAVGEFGIDGETRETMARWTLPARAAPTQRKRLPARRRERSRNEMRVPRKPPVYRGCIGGRAAGFSGGRGREGDFGEGEVFGGAAGALLPVEEELAVAVGEAGGGVDVEFGQGAVDPVGGAFELGVVADGGLVDDEVGDGVGVGADGVGPLGAVLLVDEGGR